jgi:hypothetical protein
MNKDEQIKQIQEQDKEIQLIKDCTKNSVDWRTYQECIAKQ